MIFDPGNIEVSKIECNFSDFINEELSENSEKLLLSSTFDQWRRLSGKGVPEMCCVGYEVPLFLGGKNKIENLDVIDVDVYWSIAAQLKEAIADLEEGTIIEGITIE